MRYFAFAFFLSLVLFLTGCCGNNDLLLDKNISVWAPYNSGEEIVLKTSDNLKSLSFVSEIKNDNQTATDKVCGDYKVETKVVTLKNIENPNLKFQVILSHEAVVSLKVISIQPAAIGLDIQFNTISEKYISDDWQDKYLKSISLNGKSYQNVLFVHGSGLPGNSGFSEIYYGKEVGVIGLKTISGEWFYR